ncbi:chaperone protein [Cyclospora cayetanensis]|uniref:Chaperone protein n=1 Tax=Cyclospora cayetanensis TaxID=88456 RepID=A0A1D3CRD5_9EIME|nr:chaperone protein [Cyclospora cayetanensis]
MQQMRIAPPVLGLITRALGELLQLRGGAYAWLLPYHQPVDPQRHGTRGQGANTEGRFKHHWLYRGRRSTSNSGCSSSSTLTPGSLKMPQTCASLGIPQPFRGNFSFLRRLFFFTAAAGIVGVVLAIRAEARAWSKGTVTHGPATDPSQWEDRLSPVSSILVFVGADEVAALREALPFQYANVTLPEQRLVATRTVGTVFTDQLSELGSSPLKKLRTTAVHQVERPLKVNVEGPYEVRCLEGGVAMLVSIGHVHVYDGLYYAHLYVHREDGSKLTILPDSLPLAALNPFLWGNNRPQSRPVRHPIGRGIPAIVRRTDSTQETFSLLVTLLQPIRYYGTAFEASFYTSISHSSFYQRFADVFADVSTFRGTAVCPHQGAKLQVVEGWPVKVPKFADGPWEVTVLVERCFLTPSSDKKQHLLHADLKVLKVPRDTVFLAGFKLQSLPFAGYVSLPSKYHGLEAAIVRERIIGRSCLLRRTEAKSNVELKCDELIDAKLASLNKLYKDRPPLLKTIKGVGLLMGCSVGAFAIAAFMQLLGSIDGKPMGDPEGCVAVGAVSAIVSILAALVDAPRVGLKYWRWREKFRRKTGRIVEQTVKNSAGDHATKGVFLDFLLVVPASELRKKRGLEQEESVSLTRSQELAYADIIEVLQLRAEAAALNDIPLKASELESLDMPKDMKAQLARHSDEAELLKEVAQRSSTTGLRFGEDGSVRVPSHMVFARVYHAAADKATQAVEAVAGIPAHPVFALLLRKALLVGHHLWRELSEVQGFPKIALPASQPMDFVPLSLCSTVYNRLKESGKLLGDAQLAQGIKERLLEIQASEEAGLKALLEAKIKEAVDRFMQALATAETEGTVGAHREALESRLDEMKRFFAAANVSDDMLPPSIFTKLKNLDDSESEGIDFDISEDGSNKEEFNEPSAASGSRAGKAEEGEDEEIPMFDAEDFWS